MTTTLNDWYGNGRVAPGLGFLWNNEMDDFATAPGKPNIVWISTAHPEAEAGHPAELEGAAAALPVGGTRWLPRRRWWKIGVGIG